MLSRLRLVKLGVLYGTILIVIRISIKISRIYDSSSSNIRLLKANRIDKPHPGQNTTIRKPTLSRHRPPVNCVRLIKGDEAEQRRAEEYQKNHPKKTNSNAEYIKVARDCAEFVENRDYITSSLNEEEKNFALAFGITVFRDLELFERLLRAVYRPQNFYCVHADNKSEESYHKAIHEIAKCFDNVFVLKNNIKVIWGKYSNIETEILCTKALLKYKKWKYFINLTGQEFPLKTNWELVQILKALNGTNLVEATIKHRNKERFAGRPPPPIDVILVKGNVHIVVRREFVEYAVENENAKKLLNWTKLVGNPDEVFFSTLNHNPKLGIPGSYLGEHESNRIKNPFINRYTVWDSSSSLCHGKFARNVCIFGVGDLPALATTPFLFANKFHLHYQPLALDCLEELIYNRTKEELLGNGYFNTSYYQNLDVVRNHI